MHTFLSFRMILVCEISGQMCSYCGCCKSLVTLDAVRGACSIFYLVLTWLATPPVFYAIPLVTSSTALHHSAVSFKSLCIYCIIFTYICFETMFWKVFKKIVMHKCIYTIVLKWAECFLKMVMTINLFSRNVHFVS